MEPPLGVAKTRIRDLTAATSDAPDPKCVIYWMHAAIRESHNHALETAAASATNRKLPLLALFVLDRGYPDWSERNFQFCAEGLKDAQAKLHARGVPFAVLQAPDAEGVSKTVAEVARAARAARIVTEAPMPMHRSLKWVRGTAALLDDLPMVQVETNVVVPIETASGKEEYAARTLRPKIHRVWHDYFTRLPRVEMGHAVKEWPGEALKGQVEWDMNVDSLVDMCRRATKVTSFFKGGYDAAMKVLDEFVDRKLVHYATQRNEPAAGGVSDLSPYLRHGHISPVEVALRVRGHRSSATVRASVDAFLEEMIVRRELAYNMCHYNDKYDSMEVLPNYAKETLAIHKDDKRPWDYDYETLECALTHCPYWNAAQIELLVTGKMHGYMRMFWCKKILEWTDTAEKAFSIAVRLNNLYNVDGSDPNSYAGVAWCFGKHDQGWREREIFGKVRYMNDAGLKRKFDMQAYVDKMDKLAASHMPKEIKEVREKKGVKRQRQGTITDMKSKAKRRRKKVT